MYKYTYAQYTVDITSLKSTKIYLVSTIDNNATVSMNSSNLLVIDPEVIFNLTKTADTVVKEKAASLVSTSWKTKFNSPNNMW